MTDATDELILYRRTDAPGVIHGVPDRDLTQRDVDRLAPYLLREVRHSDLYDDVELTPAQKGALTRAANKRAEEEAAAAGEAARREADALAVVEADAAAHAEVAGPDAGEGSN